MSYETTVDADIYAIEELNTNDVRKKLRHREREERIQALRDAGIQFTTIAYNKRLEMRDGFGNKVRFWSGTERWTVQYNSYKGFGDRGVQKLITYLQSTRKPTNEQERKDESHL